MSIYKLSSFEFVLLRKPTHLDERLGGTEDKSGKKYQRSYWDFLEKILSRDTLKRQCSIVERYVNQRWRIICTSSTCLSFLRQLLRESFKYESETMLLKMSNWKYRCKIEFHKLVINTSPLKAVKFLFCY